MRLIDAELLLLRISDRYDAKKNIVPDNLAEGFVQMEKLIKEQPTSFDAENIIKQLEKERDSSYEDYENYAEKHNMDVALDDLFCRGLDRAIEIVKRGGRDEEYE